MLHTHLVLYSADEFIGIISYVKKGKIMSNTHHCCVDDHVSDHGMLQE